MAKTKKTTKSVRKITLGYRHYVNLVVVVVGSLVMVGSVAWLAQDLVKIRAELESEKVELEELNQKVVALEVLSGGELEQIRSTVDVALPSEKPVFEILASVNNVAEESGVSILELSTTPGNLATVSAIPTGSGDSVSEGRGRTRRKFDQVAITLSASGDFGALTDFILKLASIVPLVDVNEVRLSSIGSGGSSGSEFTGELDVVVYWMRDPKVEFRQGEVKASSLTASQRDTYGKLTEFGDYSLR